MEDLEKEDMELKNAPCIVQLFERVAKVEAESKAKFEEIFKIFSTLDRARDLAREVHDKEKEDFTKSLAYKLDVMNNFQRRMEKLEASFATNNKVESDIKALSEKIDLAAQHVREKLDNDISNLRKFHINDMEHQGKKMETTQKIVWVGLGVAIGLQFVVGLAYIILKHILGG